MPKYISCGKPFYRIYHRDTSTWIFVDAEEEEDFDIDEYIAKNKKRGLHVEIYELETPVETPKRVKGFGKTDLPRFKKKKRQSSR